MLYNGAQPRWHITHPGHHQHTHPHTHTHTHTLTHVSTLKSVNFYLTDSQREVQHSHTHTHTHTHTYSMCASERERIIVEGICIWHLNWACTFVQVFEEISHIAYTHFVWLKNHAYCLPTTFFLSSSTHTNTHTLRKMIFLTLWKQRKLETWKRITSKRDFCTFIV